MKTQTSIHSFLAKLILPMLSLMLSPQLFAQQSAAYRCEENGRTVYQATPCAGGKAVEGATRPSAQQRAIAEDQADQEKRDARQMAAERRERERMKGNTAGAGEMGTMKATSTEERERRDIKNKGSKGKKAGKKRKTHHPKNDTSHADDNKPRKARIAKP